MEEEQTTAQKTQRKAEMDEKQKYITSLRKQLEQISAAQAFPTTPAGELVIKILTEDIALFTRRITSDEFVNNHEGYLDVRAKLNYAASFLNRLSSLQSKSTEADVREKLDVVEKSTDV